MRTPAEQAIYLAERPVYDAASRLEKSIATLASLRTATNARLPIVEAEAEMDDIDDHFAAIGKKLAAALAIHDAAIERMQIEEDVRYIRANGLFALADRAANDNAKAKAA